MTDLEFIRRELAIAERQIVRFKERIRYLGRRVEKVVSSRDEWKRKAIACGGTKFKVTKGIP